MKFDLTKSENKIWKQMVKSLKNEEVKELENSARTKISCIRKNDMYIIKILVNDVLFFAAKTSIKLSFNAMEKSFVENVKNGFFYKPWLECSTEERVDIYRSFTSLAKEYSYKKDIVRDSYMKIVEVTFSLEDEVNPNLCSK